MFIHCFVVVSSTIEKLPVCLLVSGARTANPARQGLFLALGLFGAQHQGMWLVLSKHSTSRPDLELHSARSFVLLAPSFLGLDEVGWVLHGAWGWYLARCGLHSSQA